MDMKPINKKAHRLLGKVQAHQAPYWECMRPGVVNVPEIQGLNGVRLHEVVREAQRSRLQEKYGMIQLYVQRETLFQSFKDQVLVTPTFQEARKVLVIIHDPYDCPFIPQTSQC
jgi:histone deacetylase 6